MTDHGGACMAIDMGGGKSLVAIGLLNLSRARRVLIVCPNSVVDVWPKQFRLHSPVDWHLVGPGISGVGSKVEAFDLALNECRCGRPHACVVNYEASAHQPLRSWAPAQTWDWFVFDEGHRLRGGGVWSKWAAKVAKSAERRLELTGTPMPQSPLDVYWQYRSLNADIFGPSATSFKHRYAIFGGYGGHQVIGYKNEEELHEKFYSIAFRVDAADVLDLPETMPDVTRACTLSPRAQRLYRSLENDLYAEVAVGSREVDGEDRRVLVEAEGEENLSEVSTPNVLVKLLRLQQITGGALRTDDGETIEVDTSKADLLLDVLQDYPSGEPVVVFCRFIHDLDVVRSAAARVHRRYGEVSGRGSCLVEGALPPDVDLIGVQVQAGGVGVDFTRARYAVWYSLGFSLGDYLQARARLVRPGQTRPVQFTHLVSTGSVDERIYQALEARQDVVTYVLRTLSRPPEREEEDPT